MDHLPDELLQCIFSAIYDDTQSRWEQVQEEQASRAALSRTCKRLYWVGRVLLLERAPCLDTILRIKQYQLACLSRVNPFSLAKGGQQNGPRIRALHLLQSGIFEGNAEPKPSECLLPDLRPLDYHGCFRSLTKITILGWTDESFLVPTLLGPFSPLRRQLERITFIPAFMSIADWVGLSFILDATIYLPPSHFRARPILPLSLVFPNTSVYHHPLGPDDVSVSECDAEGSPSRAILAKARTDFETFASQWDDNQLKRLRLRPRDLVESSLQLGSPFEKLHTLTMTIYDSSQVVLLLATRDVPNLKTLRLQGPNLVISSDQYALIRRTISRSEDDLLKYGPEGACPRSFNNFLDAFAALFEISWEPLSKVAVRKFGDYAGPRLRLLDVAIENVKVIESSNLI
ncbi:hypothetical protein JCM16303_004971 [Sporobolomyces ruberrimus]